MKYTLRYRYKRMKRNIYPFSNIILGLICSLSCFLVIFLTPSIEDSIKDTMPYVTIGFTLFGFALTSVSILSAISQTNETASNILQAGHKQYFFKTIVLMLISVLISVVFQIFYSKVWIIIPLCIFALVQFSIITYYIIFLSTYDKKTF